MAEYGDIDSFPVPDDFPSPSLSQFNLEELFPGVVDVDEVEDMLECNEAVDHNADVHLGIKPYTNLYYGTGFQEMYGISDTLSKELGELRRTQEQIEFAEDAQGPKHKGLFHGTFTDHAVFIGNEAYHWWKTSWFKIEQENEFYR